MTDNWEIFNKAMALLEDVPGETLLERVAKLKGWYVEMQSLVSAQEEDVKLAYVKRWRTIVKLPAKYAEEIVEALRSGDPAQAVWHPIATAPKGPVICVARKGGQRDDGSTYWYQAVGHYDPNLGHFHKSYGELYGEPELWAVYPENPERCSLSSTGLPAPAPDKADFYLVPREIIDQFPEININNYDHDDACALNAWGCHVVTSANPAPSSSLPAAAPHAEVREGLTERLVTGAWDDARAQAIEECAKIVEGEVIHSRYREWPAASAQGNRANDSEIVRHCDRLAEAIRALALPQSTERGEVG